MTSNKVYLLGGLGNEDYPDDGNPNRQNSISSFSQNDNFEENEHSFNKIIERLKALQEEDCINYVYENLNSATL